MNVEKLSLVELTALNEKVVAQIPIARKRELDAARKELADLAAAKGYSIRELLDAPKTRRGTGRARRPATKMRDAKGVIWAGRGRMPKGFDRASATAA